MWFTLISLLSLSWPKGNCGWPDVNLKTKGEIWPVPQVFKKTGVVWQLDPKNLKIIQMKECDIISEAIARYREKFCIHHTISDDFINLDVLNSLTIYVHSGCPTDVPQFGMDESYKIDITSENATLKASEVWGAIRGLESFSQLIFYDNANGCQINGALIRDFPRFPHRGVLLDTSRHYLSLNALKANIELMAQNKFNVFHWHIVDETSFPYKSKALPDLKNGAFSPKHMYTIEDVKDIIAYARLRGIRVLPEFDTPGHTKSWGAGYKNLLSRCFNKGGEEVFDRSILDPTQEDTFDILLALFKEVFQVFPDDYMHLGGDETEFWIPNCWENNKNITDFMKIYGLLTPKDLEQWYFDRLITMLRNIRGQNQKKFLVWQEVLDMTNEQEVIAHVWKGNTMQEISTKMYEVTSKGHYAILSSCWYLDRISTSADWLSYYLCDPQDFNGTAEQKNMVLGGEAALWGEWVDDSNVVPRLWPRASAVAERLWSASIATKNATKAWPRLYEMQCRMKARGYPVQPANGPGFCDIEYHTNLPV